MKAPSWIRRLFGIPDPPVDGSDLGEVEQVRPSSEPMRDPAVAPLPTPEGSRQVVIGLDFGTSSSKVVFRWLGERVAHVFPNPRSQENFWFCTPTTVTDRGGEPEVVNAFETLFI